MAEIVAPPNPKVYYLGKKRVRWPMARLCNYLPERGEDCVLGSLLGVACAVQATKG